MGLSSYISISLGAVDGLSQVCELCGVDTPSVDARVLFVVGGRGLERMREETGRSKHLIFRGTYIFFD